MKKLLILILLSTFSMMTKSQIRTTYNLDGYWGTWRSQVSYNVYGNYSGFVLYESYHPSDYVFKFQIDSYKAPDKKTIKRHRKNNLWYNYYGTVEYYVSEKYPTVRAMLKAKGFPFRDYGWGVAGNPRVKRTAKAKISIQPYKKYPRVYNIWFDDVAVGIDLWDVHFNN